MIKAIKRVIMILKVCVFSGAIGAAAFVGFKYPPATVGDVRDVKYTKDDIDAAIQEYGVKDCGIAAPVWQGIVQIESDNGQNNHVVNLTASQLAQAKKYTKNTRYYGDAISAHGPLQIMGWNALRLQKELGLNDPPFDDLYRLETAFRASCRILREIQSTMKGVKGRALVAGVVERYNGTGPAARDYNRKVMKVVDANLYDRLLTAPREQLDTKGMDNLLARLW